MQSKKGKMNAKRKSERNEENILYLTAGRNFNFGEGRRENHGFSDQSIDPCNKTNKGSKSRNRVLSSSKNL
jgi:hypothetical protein